MSLCSQCGHNSAMHNAGNCWGTGYQRIVDGRYPCACTLEPWDRLFREGHDDRGNLRPGYPTLQAGMESIGGEA